MGAYGLGVGGTGGDWRAVFVANTDLKIVPEYEYVTVSMRYHEFG